MKIDFLELPGPDLDAMQAFYGAAFGWTFTAYGGAYMDFAGAGIAGGFNPHRAPAPAGAGALTVLYADDLAAAAAAVRDAGGDVGESEAFPGGRRFTFTDPCGNELAVWTKA